MPLEANTASRDRLKSVMDRLTVADLDRPTASGRTVAICLVQLAFWDLWAEHLIGRWRSGQLPPPTMPTWYDDAISATMVPIWRAVPVTDVGRLAVEAAEAVDLVIARVETPVAAAIFSAGEGHLLRRYAAREATLDAIEHTLGG